MSSSRTVGLGLTLMPARSRCGLVVRLALVFPGNEACFLSLVMGVGCWGASRPLVPSQGLVALNMLFLGAVQWNLERDENLGLTGRSERRCP